MLTGFEALGAASAVLQVISFATDITVACKKAYDGATTSEDDLHRHAKQMSEAVERVKSRCGQMTNTNNSFSTPELKTISQDCRNAARELEAQVSYVTSLQAKGDIGKAFCKAFRTFRRKKKLEDLEKSLFRYKQLIDIELQSHLCSRSEAIRLKQESAFQKLDTDVQSLVNQLAQGVTDVQNLVKHEHTTTRCAITQETARAEVAINSHTDSQVLELRTAADINTKYAVFLQSLKAPRMNQRYNDVMDSKDASFNQVFATYEDMRYMYRGASKESGHSTGDDDPENTDTLEDCNDSEYDDDTGDDYDTGDGGDNGDDSDDSGDINSEGYGSFDGAHYDMECVYRSWESFNMWLPSDDKLFYIQGKPGSGKSTLVKFILNQHQTRDLIQRWSPDAIITSYFFWKIGSEEQNSIKGLWCSLLYQRLKDQQKLALNVLQHFSRLSLHSDYHDWSIKDLQDVWNYLTKMDTRHVCIFIDGLDEIRNKDGFYKLAQSIQLILQLPRTKLCVSARPEAPIVRWLQTTNAAGIRLEDLTRLDMLHFVRRRFRQISPSDQVSSEGSQDLRHQLVDKAQGVFLWLYLATQSIAEGIENMDSEDMLFARLKAIPGDLENLYIDLWQRMNANSPIYVETARRYFRYVLHLSSKSILISSGRYSFPLAQPWLLQIACGDNPEIREKLLESTGTIEVAEVLRLCEDTKASIQSRCAGLLEVRPHKAPTKPRLFQRLEDDSNTSSHVAFIHRTAHDFLTDTEAGQGILGCGPLSDLSLETKSLKGLICLAIVLASESSLLCTHSIIINEIAEFAERWGSNGLPLATEMLDVVRPLYERGSMVSRGFASGPWDPFLRLFATYDFFDDFVISRLATETSTGVATSVLRHGWTPEPRNRSFRRLSKRLFFALIKLGADPHEYGTLFSQAIEPFVARETAFTNLLISFIVSSKYLEVKHRIHTDNEPHRKELLETLEIAVYMAKACQNLDAAVLLFSCIPETRPMFMVPFTRMYNVLTFLKDPASDYVSIFYEVNIQFLLLYLLSKIGGNLANCVLAVPQAQDVLSRIDRPLVRIRYFRLPFTDSYMPEQFFSSQFTTFQRVLSPEPFPISFIEQLFDVDFDGLSQDLRKPHENKTDLYTINHYIENLETEDINFEDMLTSLAAENLGFCTYEEAGITPSYESLRKETELNRFSWMLFPLAMGRLQEAAATSEGIKGHD